MATRGLKSCWTERDIIHSLELSGQELVELQTRLCEACEIYYFTFVDSCILRKKTHFRLSNRSNRSTPSPFAVKTWESWDFRKIQHKVLSSRHKLSLSLSHGLRHASSSVSSPPWNPRSLRVQIRIHFSLLSWLSRDFEVFGDCRLPKVSPFRVFGRALQAPAGGRRSSG